MENNYPETFYKYRPANDYTVSLLKKYEIQFAYAEEYSDPFDSKVIIKKESDIDAVLRKLETTPIDEEEKRSLRKRIEEGGIVFEQLRMAAYEAAKHSIMSSCFSTKSDNLLLWSHYAESHKGICVGIRNCSSTDIPGMKFNIRDSDLSPGPISSEIYERGVFVVYKVDYSDSGIVEWEIYKDNFKILMDAHTTKAKCWEYEDEYRLLLARNAFRSRTLNFDPRFLVEIYFGCRIETEFQTKVQQVLKECYLNKGIPVKVFQMVASKKNFALEKIELRI